MQKVIRRTILAERQAARKLARQKETRDREWRKTNREQTLYQRKQDTQLLRDAKLHRREDWELGPIKPRRDVGEDKDKYGTLGTGALKGPILEEAAREKERASIGGKWMNIVKGDRVVLLEGRDKGKIGKIIDVNTESCEFTVEGLNRIDISVPAWMIGEEETDRRPIRTVEKPIKFSKVRLVYALPDQETGITRDVIVKKIENTSFWHQKNGKTNFTRIIANMNVKIPWPKLSPQEYTEHPGDTPRLEVETKTFMPTLLTPPMPGSVIDELRNKYSVFRTRHDADYIAKKEAEDAEVALKQRQAREMRITPLKEIHYKERAVNRAKNNRQLTPDMKIRIGKLIAEKQAMMMKAGGMSASQTLSA